MNLVRQIVMPILTIGGFGAMTYQYVYGRVPLEAYAPMVGMMVAFWFAVNKDKGGE